MAACLGAVRLAERGVGLGDLGLALRPLPQRRRRLLLVVLLRGRHPRPWAWRYALEDLHVGGRALAGAQTHSLIWHTSDRIGNTTRADT